MIEEALAAAEALREGQVVEIYRWVRELALRIALRALLGMDGAEGRERTLAAAFEAVAGDPRRAGPAPAAAAARGRPLARAIAARETLDRACARRSKNAGAEAIRAAACSGCC